MDWEGLGMGLRVLRQRVLHLETQVQTGRDWEGLGMGLRALRQRVLHLETQGRIQRSVLGRAEQACAGLREQLRAAAAQSQGLQAQLSESHRKHAEAQCKREEGRLQGQLEHSDAAQYIRHLQGHIRQLKAEIRLLRGPLSFGAVALGTRLGDEDSLGSSDEELPPPFALTPGDIGDIGDTGDSSDSEPEVPPAAP
ncbi:EVI5-like protein isoform X2 [Haemorhous mexicanus]|uniref:EVI5-like protein isoform X2 n=1 Tax=Haemorhous mexicanus TaxID=30427 RepID=UPI0028BE5B1C|nr:EVI5-like protein isoform X2 [Haemorhous mexicanus]